MKFKRLNKSIFFTILVIFSIQLFGLGFLFFSPVRVDAQVTFTPQVDVPGSEFKGGIEYKKGVSGTLIAEYIQAWYKFAIAGIGILAVVMIMAGGFLWLTAAGRANQISTAKDWIMGAVIGLVLALMSYTLLDILNPNLVTFESLNIKEVKPVEFGLCCIPSSGVASAKEAKDCTKNNGVVCNLLQSCRKTNTGEYGCVDTKEGDSCSDVLGSTETCPKNWFCVNGGCYNGSAGDPCDLSKTSSCAYGFYCIDQDIGARVDTVCLDGKEGDICSETKQCNEPMACIDVWSRIGKTCQYDVSIGKCKENGESCSRNRECCSGDCEGILEGQVGGAKCVVAN